LLVPAYTTVAAGMTYVILTLATATLSKERLLALARRESEHF